MSVGQLANPDPQLMRYSMHQITTEQLRRFLSDHEPPCASLYMPTHRHNPDNLQDSTRYKNLLRDLERSLREKYGTRDVRSLLEPFQALTDDYQFWTHRLDGLAVLGSTGAFQIFEVQRRLPELAVVADSFHVKPLLRVVQSADRYQVLCVNRHRAKLYEGNRDALDEVTLESGAATIEEALGEELSEPHQTVASYGEGAGSPRAAHGEPRMYHGHGSKKDEVDIDAERYFRAVDRAVLEKHSRPSGLPLVLAALTEHHAVFRGVSHNPQLLPAGIMRDPFPLNADQLRSAAWEVVGPGYLERLAGLVDDFQVAQSRHLGTSDLSDAAAAAVTGRVGVLLVEAERQIPGKLDPSTGRTVPGELADPRTDDLLDDLAELVLKTGGQVVIVPAERMPTKSGLAATFRY